MMDLTGKRVVVTGGARGIGAALGSELTAAGAQVLLADRDGDAVRTTAHRMGAHSFVGDLTDPAVPAQLMDTALSELGGVDVFFANAGTDTGGGLETDDRTWDLAWAVNTLAHVRTARALVPHWLAHGGGHLVITASAAGLLTMIGNAPYSVTKHATVAFAEWLAVEYGERGITVQALCPQGVATRMLADAGPVHALLSQDSALTPEQVATATLQALDSGRFLVLPHPEVAGYYATRAADTDGWLAGMRRVHRRVFDR